MKTDWFVGVARSQQKVSDMKEVSSIMKESVWVEDKNITDCKGCNKPFSVSRRKVHYSRGPQVRYSGGGGLRLVKGEACDTAL